jgi:hypothetical protein
VLLAVWCALVACGDRGEAPVGDASPLGGTGPDAPAETEVWQRCTHESGGFTVEYPLDWRTNDGSVMPACSLFDPFAIEVPVGSELPADIAIVIGVEQVSSGEIAGSTFGLRELEREEVQVAGRRAVRRLVEHTGDGLWDRGMRSWSYIVPWADGRTLLAESHDVGEQSFTEKRRVLDEMMRRLRPE